MPMPEDGIKAPQFKGLDQDGKPVSLKDFVGKKVVLFFYPQDDTPTCTEQACNLRDNHALLLKEEFVVLGVSPDDSLSHQKFIGKFNLPFSLIADPQHKIIEKYGVWGEKQMFGNRYMGLLRTTFLIDEKGVIRKVFRKPRVKNHAQEIINSWQALSGEKGKQKR